MLGRLEQLEVRSENKLDTSVGHVRESMVSEDKLRAVEAEQRR